MAGSERAQFKVGGGFASMIIGGAATVLALFNWATITFGWPLAPFAEPIVTLYRDAVEWLMAEVSVRADWAIPDWPPSVFGLALVSAALGGRVMVLFDRNDMRKSTLPVATSLLWVVLLFVPYARWLSVLVIAFFAVLSPVLGFFPGFLDDTDDHDYRSQSYYVLGLLASTAFGLAVNYWYG